MRNTISNSSDTGIYLEYLCNNNTITLNLISNNTVFELYVYDECDWNFIFKNWFIGNGLHAVEDRNTFNQWDDGYIGNYWDNYTGPDNNRDGIGDIPYNITGDTGSKDRYPSMTPTWPSRALPAGDDDDDDDEDEVAEDYTVVAVIIVVAIIGGIVGAIAVLYYVKPEIYNKLVDKLKKTSRKAGEQLKKTPEKLKKEKKET